MKKIISPKSSQLRGRRLLLATLKS